ncbi:hypothetical protein HHK36_010537 [Tetracentron sinense]|uniref:TF-B3 domain-containing protein n=1 Tax=Tetracentron sinense TaxID=13715 RepID=A0A835DFD8_TETSI|nr:hypothetical protein HHK36_010537 [Tetracentron sinense]
MASGSTINTYDEARKKRLNDNKKRFEDLGILKISNSLSEVRNSVNKSSQRHKNPKSGRSVDILELRRSSRARNSVSSYYEEVNIGVAPLRKRKLSSSWSSYLARPLDEVKMASYEEREYAIKRAEEFQSNLQSGHPSFVKSMVRSHVYSCFWLGLPSNFCKDHLPKKELNMLLEDENGTEYDANYIGSRSGLSGGWRGFALDHKLDDGDALVFELTEPSRFKVYIFKASMNDGTRAKRASESKKIADVEECGDAYVSQKLCLKRMVDNAGKLNKAVKADENEDGSECQKPEQKCGANNTSKSKGIVENGGKSVYQNLQPKHGVDNAGKSKTAVKANENGEPEQKCGANNTRESKKIFENGDKSVSQNLRQKRAVDNADKSKTAVKADENGDGSDFQKPEQKCGANDTSESKEIENGSKSVFQKLMHRGGVNSSIELKITIDNSNGSVSDHIQQNDDLTKLRKKTVASTKLFRRKVY